MRDKWYSDNRDLVKWSVLLLLARRFRAGRILQIAYYGPSDFATVEIDGHRHDVPSEVLSHFRDIRKVVALTSRPRITVFDSAFEGRDSYLHAVKNLIASFADEHCVVFLDPDTGLEPSGTSGPQHVLNREARVIWGALPPEWVLVFYQHQTNRSARAWVEPKRVQFAESIGMPLSEVKVAAGPKIASDVAFFFVLKPNPSLNLDAPHKRRAG